ncbi:beta-ketoacyl synthase chain length factor [Saccharopolyspora sp. 5N102]|uniref:beta-ketoacyl synthase chain length factor n=1 Tax=Saccharopolyspora sp. 5N102 TaxID=3375155 RepID=UPI003794D211
MTNEIHCSLATVAADFDLGRVAELAVAPEPTSDLAPLLRRYRSPRSAVVVQGVWAWLQRAGSELPPPVRRGIVLGTATGASPDIEGFLDESIRVGDHLVNPALFPMTVHNAAAGNAAIVGQCRGPNVVVSAGNESARSALSTAQALLCDGAADVVFVGGVESQRLANGETGTIAALIVISADPAPLGGAYLAPLTARLHQADVPSRSAVREPSDSLPSDADEASAAALVEFANAFAADSSGAAEPGGNDDAEEVAR